MSLAGSQQRTLLAMLARLQPHWRHDRTLPGRVQALLASDRRFGSRDRRLYRELLYTALRYLPWVEAELQRDPERATSLIAWLAADSPATERFRAALLDGWPPCPPSAAEKAQLLAARLAHCAAPVDPASHDAAPAAAVAPDSDGRSPAALLPGWFREHCPAAFDSVQLDALLSRAPLWLRLQTHDVEPVLAEFRSRGWDVDVSSLLPHALQVLGDVDVTRTTAYQNGWIEIQDLGSQLVLASLEIEPGGRWLDACAGAGGKTLQLAALLGPDGYVDAHDVRRAALEELALRAQRAGLPLTRTLPARTRTQPGRAPAMATAAGQDARLRGAAVRIVGSVEDENYDGVLIDAPCSGSGTWRRAPHLKWTTTPAHIEQAAARQRELLDVFSRRVRPGGRLIYATCSLCRSENQDVVAAFLATHRDFAVEPPPRSFGAQVDAFGLTILPALHNSDGFFVASLRRR